MWNTRSVPHTLCRPFQTCRRIEVYLSSEEHLHPSLTRQGLQDMTDLGNLRWENRPPNRSASRKTGLEMSCFPPIDQLWVQITQSYPNRLRFSRLPCPQSPCHTVIDPVFKGRIFLKVKTSFPTKTLVRVSGHQRWGMEECSSRLVQIFPDL